MGMIHWFCLPGCVKCGPGDPGEAAGTRERRAQDCERSRLGVVLGLAHIGVGPNLAESEPTDPLHQQVVEPVIVDLVHHHGVGLGVGDSPPVDQGHPLCRARCGFDRDGDVFAAE